MENYVNANWWKFMEEPMRDLAKASYALLDREQREHDGMHDYSFVVFPMAKAYEGFLKKLFFEMGLINKQQYYGEHFRIGKALSPTLPKRYRSGWVYGKLLDNCGGETLPLKMWGVWKQARNSIFHYFPDHKQFISLLEAQAMLNDISEVMEEALAGCTR